MGKKAALLRISMSDIITMSRNGTVDLMVVVGFRDDVLVYSSVCWDSRHGNSGKLFEKN